MFGIRQIKVSYVEEHPHQATVFWGAFIVLNALLAYLANRVDMLCARFGFIIIDIGIIGCLLTKAFDPAEKE